MTKSPIFWLRLTIIVSIITLLSLVTSIYLPIILSVIIAFILNPIVDFFCHLPVRYGKRELPRPLGILLAFILAAVTFMTLGTFILLPFIHEFDKFIVELPGLMRKIQSITLAIEHQATTIELPDNVRGLLNQSISRAASFSVELAKHIVNALVGFASQVVELVVVPVLTYYLLKDWRSLQSSFIDVFSIPYRLRLSQILKEMGHVISGYIRGQVLISLIIGLFVFVGMYMFRVDYPLVLGLLAALTETIPVVGPVIGAVPAVLLAFIASPTLAVKVIIFYIVIQQVENQLIVPKIMGHTINLHPILVVISLLIGGSLYGVIGMMLAVPVAALLKVLVRHLWYYSER